MCLGLSVNLPTVQSFLLMYPLRCGCTTILLWTLARSSFTFAFFVTCTQEAFVNRHIQFVGVFIKDHSKAWTEENVFQVYFSYITMTIVEVFLFVFCYHLAVGIYCPKSRPLSHFLIVRFPTWLIEVVVLFVLALVHRLLIAWYLGLLLSVILEFYAFVIVYSYYVEVQDDERSRSRASCKPCDSSELFECS